MRFTMRGLLVLTNLLIAATAAQAQVGRPIPMPRFTPGPGGPHGPFPFPFNLFGDSDIGMYLLIIFGALAVIYVGFAAGSSLGRWQRGLPVTSRLSAATTNSDPLFVTPPPDLIRTPDDVADKSMRTTRLMSVLAKREPLFEPEPLREWILDYFHEAEKCWQARDPAAVKDRMTPQAFAKYDELIRAMRRNREINRIEDSLVCRLEFVHVSCPAESENHTITALITYQAKAYFVEEKSGAYQRGFQKNTLYQDFWVFQRHGDGWKLHDFQESWNDKYLREPNRLHGMSEVDLRNAENGVILL
jgi:hypothetical protein